MTISSRRILVTLMAMTIALQVLIAGNRLPAGENKNDPAHQGPTPKQLEEVTQWFEAMLDWCRICPSSKELEEITRQQATTWQLVLRLNMPTLDPQAVQYAIFETDPAFDAAAKRLVEFVCGGRVFGNRRRNCLTNYDSSR